MVDVGRSPATPEKVWLRLGRMKRIILITNFKNFTLETEKKLLPTLQVLICQLVAKNILE